MKGVYSRKWYIEKREKFRKYTNKAVIEFERIIEFERRLSVKVRRQEKLEIVEKKDFRRRELPKKYIEKMLHG